MATLPTNSPLMNTTNNGIESFKAFYDTALNPSASKKNQGQVLHSNIPTFVQHHDHSQLHSILRNIQAG